MKKLSYRQFYYGGNYTTESIDLPDDTLIFKFNDIGLWNPLKNTYSYSILILTKSEIENLYNICTFVDNLGDYYLNILNNVDSDYNFDNYNNFPKLDFYLVATNFNKTDTNLPVNQIERNSIYQISKFKSADIDTFYFSCVTIKDSFNMSDMFILSLDCCGTDIFYYKDTKVVFGDKYKKLYDEFYNKVLSKINN